MNSQTNFSNIVLTGDRPTGSLHLGHYVGSMQNRLKLQNQYDSCFYMVADIQALTDNFDNPQKVRQNVMEVVLDNLAVGLDPQKTNIFIQSMIPQIAELTVLFLNMTTLQRLLQNPTIKTEVAQKGYSLEIGEKDSTTGKGVPAGFLCYPVSQAADILFAKATHIPVGNDQLPVIEQAREIARMFNRYYGEVFPQPQAVLSDIQRLVGTDGNAKASKSLGNAIFLKDSPDVIEQKVRGMYTDPDHIRVEDPGKVEGNVVFAYLDAFDPQKDEVAQLKQQYQAGGLGDMVLKKRLIGVLRDLLDPIREKRETLADNMDEVEKIVQTGTEKALECAEATMKEVRETIGIDYFSA